MNRNILNIFAWLAPLVIECTSLTSQAAMFDIATNPIQSSPKVEHLVEQLTLEEKIKLLSGVNFDTQAVERLNIPALKMTDGPVGIRFGEGTTAWPAAIGLASTFDPELIGELATALGEEARSQDKRLLLGPTVNITRTPWGGRVFESYGEDPFLTSELAASYVRGVQANQVGTSIKHFAVNNQEYGRGQIDVHVSERALREIYWPAFASGVRAGTVSVMAAYNKINGAHCSENSHLLLDVLKHQWGFDGFVVSDWGATHSTIAAAMHGLDLEMPIAHYFGGDLLSAVKNQSVPTTVIEDKVRRILSAMERLDMLETNEHRPESKTFEKHHPDLALKVAQQSLVLLKNEDSILPLPLHSSLRLALLGPSATHARTGGGGSSFVHNPEAVASVDGLKRRISETNSEIHLQIDDHMSLPGDGVKESDLFSAPVHGEFFGNTTLSGLPVAEKNFSKFDFDWEWGSPDKSINGDFGYSARFTTTLKAKQTGLHDFKIAFTQAARVYLNDHLIYDHWKVDENQSPLIYDTVQTTLVANQSYELKVEYFKVEGLASFQLEAAAFRAQRFPKELLLQKSLAEQNDYVILFVGQSAKTESESFDRVSLKLSKDQEDLIVRTADLNPNTIVVVQAGSPIDMTSWSSKVKAILYGWYPGEQGGLAIADVLMGLANPSGRLPITFPKTWEDSPAAVTYPGVNGVTTYTDDIFVGYRAFDLNPLKAAYRFGYGLSYSKFSEEIVRKTIQSASAAQPDISVVTKIKNTSSRDGSYVSQLYVGELYPSVPRPKYELKAFKKIFLKAGESKEVTFNLDAQAFHHYDESNNVWVVDEGSYKLSLMNEQGQFSQITQVDLKK